MIFTPRPAAPLVLLLVSISVAALLLSGMPRTTYATTKNYIGVDNSSWNTAGNWSPSGVPGSNDDAYLGTTKENATANLDVTFNGNYTNGALDSLTLNSSGLTGYMILNQTSSSSVMNVGTENIGTTVSYNTYNQSAGVNEPNALNVGGNSVGNSYNLSGSGTLTGGVMNVGVSGVGVVNQTGGTATFLSTDVYGNPGHMVLGENASGGGTYNLSGGTFTAVAEYIGMAGQGVFNQTGGTNNVEGTYTGSVFTGLMVGGSSSGGTGTYNLSGGTLNASMVLQTGGTFNLLSGGSFPNESLDVQGGLFKLGGGSFGSYMTVTQEGGVIQLNGYNVTFNGLASNAVVSNGATGNSTLTFGLDSGLFNGTATFQQSSGGAVQDGGTGKLGLNFPVAGSALLAGTNTYTGATTITAGLVQAGSNTGFSSGSAFVLSGGTLDANGYNVTIASLAGTSGTLSVGSGTLTAGGDNTTTSYAGTLTGTGIFNKTGSGTLTLTGGGTFSGTIDVQSGTLAVGAANGLPTASSVVLGVGTAFNVAANQTLGSFSDTDFEAVNLTNNPTLTVGGNNASVSAGTIFNGNGTLVKTGTGTFTLGFGSNDTYGPNQDTGLTITVNAGQLTLNKAPGTTAVDGALNINGGSVVLAASNQIADASVVTLSAGTFNLAGFSETIGGLSGNGTVNLGGGSLTVAQSGTATFGGILGGPGAFIKSGTGTLTLSNPGSFGGTFTVNAGQLTLQGTVNGTGFTANSGGTLSLSGVSLNLNAGSLLANAGGTVQYNNATINNGYLRGSARTQRSPTKRLPSTG